MIPTIETIAVREMASGDRNFIQVYKFQGLSASKKAYLQANLHGAEIVGNAVIQQLIEFLSDLDESQLLGEIWLVPVCNPTSTNQRTHYFSTGRFNPSDGKDWNRIFWDYEKDCEDLTEFAKSQRDLDVSQIQQNYLQRILASFAQQLEAIQSSPFVPYNDYYRYQLQSLCLDANYLIDIHSSSNQAIDYLYCFSSREESAKAFLLDYGLLMNEYDGDAFDEAFFKPWLALETELANLGKPVQFDVESWTLECGGGMQMQPESVAKGVRGIQNYLAAKGMLKLETPIQQQPIHLVPKDRLQRYYAPRGGMIQHRVALGTEVKKGDRLYQILCFNKIGKLPETVDIYAISDGLVLDIATNQAANQGEYVLTVM
ncbi:MAG: succinylglutamate desuccinylase/aspartoacylase family protein [Desertifilum sp.]|nr:succinylglutamate desuccinylase/aspartoacylase family protein [Desertifilum sp.]